MSQTTTKPIQCSCKESELAKAIALSRKQFEKGEYLSDDESFDEVAKMRINGPEGASVDIVLTDINIPKKSGIDACSEFRASEHPRAKTLPAIGISADTNHALFDNAISAGMNGMTMKPLTRETLHAHFHITLKDNKANAVFCERIQQALAKNVFFSSVCHDLRTPLNAIIGFSEMLKDGFDTKEEHDTAVNSILMSGKTMLQLVSDILDVGKLESGRMEIVPEPTDVAAIRADSELASLKVYLFTADAEWKEMYAQKGFDGILLKPANLESLKGLLP